MTLEEKIKEVRIQLRLAMNGVVSHSMRNKGITYQLNFGVDLPTLKNIALRWEKHHELAQALWREDVREFKILAGLLQPIETFTPNLADEWVKSMGQKEIAEITIMNLFQHLSYAPVVAFWWITSSNEMTRICGFLTLSRIFNKKELDEQAANEFVRQSITALKDDSYALNSASFLALRKFLAKSVKHRNWLKLQLVSLVQSNQEKDQKIYQIIQEELSYF